MSYDIADDHNFWYRCPECGWEGSEHDVCSGTDFIFGDNKHKLAKCNASKSMWCCHQCGAGVEFIGYAKDSYKKGDPEGFIPC